MTSEKQSRIRDLAHGRMNYERFVQLLEEGRNDGATAAIFDIYSGMDVWTIDELQEHAGQEASDLHWLDEDQKVAYEAAWIHSYLVSVTGKGVSRFSASEPIYSTVTEVGKERRRLRDEYGYDGTEPVVLSAYAWPGGYPYVYFDNENDELCAECATDPENKAESLYVNDGDNDRDIICRICGKTIVEADETEDDEEEEDDIE